MHRLVEKSLDFESEREFACLYWLDGSDAAQKVSRESLDAYEESRIEKYRFQEDKNRFLYARVIVRSVLASVLGCHPRDVPLKVDTGRPFIDPEVGLDIRFSISHAADAVLVSFRRDIETGIDIERHRGFDNIKDVARRVMTDTEHEQFRRLQGAESVSAFYRLWSRKEAVLKLMGTGFSVPPNEVSTGFEAEGSGVASCRGIDYTLHDGSLVHAGQRYSWAHAMQGNRHCEIPLYRVEFLATQNSCVPRAEGGLRLTLNIDP